MAKIPPSISVSVKESVVESKESVKTSESQSKKEESVGCMGSIGGSIAGLFSLVGLAIVKIVKGKKD